MSKSGAGGRSLFLITSLRDIRVGGLGDGPGFGGPGDDDEALVTERGSLVQRVIVSSGGPSCSPSRSGGGGGGSSNSSNSSNSSSSGYSSGDESSASLLSPRSQRLPPGTVSELIVGGYIRIPIEANGEGGEDAAEVDDGDVDGGEPPQVCPHLEGDVLWGTLPRITAETALEKVTGNRLSAGFVFRPLGTGAGRHGYLVYHLRDESLLEPGVTYSDAEAKVQLRSAGRRGFVDLGMVISDPTERRLLQFTLNSTSVVDQDPQHILDRIARTRRRIVPTSTPAASPNKRPFTSPLARARQASASSHTARVLAAALPKKQASAAAPTNEGTGTGKAGPGRDEEQNAHAERPTTPRSSSPPPGVLPPGTPGVPPPPPMPDFLRPRAVAHVHKTKLLHWRKVDPTAARASVWSDLASPGDTAHFDAAELEELFARAASTSSTTQRADDEAGASSTASVRLYGAHRDNEIGILRKRFGAVSSDNELVQSLVAWGPPVVGDEDACAAAAVMAPSADEARLVREYIKSGGDPARLTVPEQFHWTMLQAVRDPKGVARFARLEATLEWQLSALTNQLTVLRRATSQVRESRNFRHILRAALQLGNALNSGTRWESSAFHLDSLLLLSRVRSTVRRRPAAPAGAADGSATPPPAASGSRAGTPHGTAPTNLLGFMVRRIRADLPVSVLRVSAECPDVAPASSLDLMHIQSGLAELKEEMDAAAHVRADELHAGTSEDLPYMRAISDFLPKASASVATVTSLFDAVVVEFATLAQLFAEPEGTGPQDLFGVLRQFFEEFDAEVAALEALLDARRLAVASSPISLASVVVDNPVSPSKSAGKTHRRHSGRHGGNHHRHKHHHHKKKASTAAATTSGQP